VVLLKRLSDAMRDGDNILAIVRGSAVNQDGASQGLTVPSALSQEAVIRSAGGCQLAAQDVSYVEAHGSRHPGRRPGRRQRPTGCVRCQPRNPWLVGSVKTNIGHLEAAAGIAGVIKAVLMLQKRQIPPTLPLSSASNPALAGLQATIPTQLQSWQSSPRTGCRGQRSARSDLQLGPTPM
jgi:acyl transferase domain-containing protein